MGFFKKRSRFSRRKPTPQPNFNMRIYFYFVNSKDFPTNNCIVEPRLRSLHV